MPRPTRDSRPWRTQIELFRHQGREGTAVVVAGAEERQAVGDPELLERCAHLREVAVLAWHRPPVPTQVLRIGRRDHDHPVAVTR